MPFTADVHVDERELARTLAADVRRGLTRRPRRLPPKYFYDEAGSALFERITAVPEYYLTRAEAALLDAHAGALLAEAPPDEIVELGAGTPAKLRRLVAARDGAAPLSRYVPIDVDGGTLARAAAALLRERCVRDVHAVVGDFERHLDRVPPPRGRRLVTFLGSTIGNLDPPARRRLLAGVRGLLRPGDRLLLGVDLVKDAATLLAAYDDAAGVTAEFNRNVLRVVNRALRADFEPAAYRHEARWNAGASRIEMHLVARRAHKVHVADLALDVELEAGESIWTESSYKFTRARVAAMLRGGGLRLERWLTDGAFALAVAAPRRAGRAAVAA
jgi:L-histidine N-alpha-methyltransferase